VLRRVVGSVGESYSNSRLVKANRHFDNVRQGDVFSVDLGDDYWANQLAASNISEVKDDGLAALSELSDVYDDIYGNEDDPED